jgi:hypothetical protein
MVDPVRILIVTFKTECLREDALVFNLGSYFDTSHSLIVVQLLT